MTHLPTLHYLIFNTFVYVLRYSYEIYTYVLANFIKKVSSLLWAIMSAHINADFNLCLSNFIFDVKPYDISLDENCDQNYFNWEILEMWIFFLELACFLTLLNRVNKIGVFHLKNERTLDEHEKNYRKLSYQIKTYIWNII